MCQCFIKGLLCNHLSEIHQYTCLSDAQYPYTSSVPNSLDKELVKEVLGAKLVLFGEWLVSHTIVYPDDRYQNAYFYDVWDTDSERDSSFRNNRLYNRL